MKNRTGRSSLGPWAPATLASMWTLALETTSPRASLALIEDDTVRLERALSPGHYATELLSEVAAALAAQQLRLEDVDLFAVADGPGSFTGVRIGLTAVKGWIEALQRPAAAVSTLRAAAGAGPALAALDAGRGEVYYGVYPAGAADAGAAAAEEGVEPRADFERRLATLAWPARTPDAGLREAFPQLQPSPACLAAAVGRLGVADFQRGARRTALDLDARYLRRPDAVPW